MPGGWLLFALLRAARRLGVAMWQARIGGDKLFGDYAGDTTTVIVDRLTGQVRPAQGSVAVMSAPTSPGRSWTQALADWIGALPEPSQRSAPLPAAALGRR